MIYLTHQQRAIVNAITMREVEIAEIARQYGMTIEEVQQILNKVEQIKKEIGE